MKFTTLTTLLLSGLTLSSAAPLNSEKRDVYSPPVLYPTTGTVWYSGQRHNVTWCVSLFFPSLLPPSFSSLSNTHLNCRDNSDPPASISNRAFILLREDNIELPSAYSFFS